MTIDPSTIPDGTPFQFHCGGEDCETLHFSRRASGLFEGSRIVRTYSPDPLPSQEVPRDEWTNIKPGSRVHAEHADGTVIAGTFLWCDDPVSDEIRIGCVRQKHAKVARVFVLDEPADPDADAKAAIDNALPDGSWTPDLVLANLRAAGFDVVKAGA